MSNEVGEANQLSINLFLDSARSYVKFSFKRIPDGWCFTTSDGDIFADHNAIEFFQYLERRDQFSYPISIDIFFECLWEDLNEGILSGEELQRKLEDLSAWLSMCELTKPSW